MKDGYAFRLYVAGDAANSVKARANLAAIIRDLLSGSCVVEEVDVIKDPKRALADNILVTPTLIRVSPGPARRIVGNLSERETVVNMLGLPPKP